MEIVYKSFYFVMHVIIIFMLLRSAYYVWSARKVIANVDFWAVMLTLIAGTSHLLVELQDVDSVGNRFPLGTIFWFGAAQIVYIQSKNRDAVVFTLQDMLLRSYTKAQKLVLNKIRSSTTEVNDALWEEFNKFEYNKIFVVDSTKKTSICRIKNPEEDTHIIEAMMLTNGKFPLQTHSDCIEYLYVSEGEVEETETKKTYKKGDDLVIEKGQVHGFIANKPSKLRVHLVKTK